MVADMQDVIVVLESLYADALVDAGESFQRAEKNTTGDGGDVMYMSRDIADVTEDTVRHDLSEVYNGNNVSSQSYIPLSKTTPFALRYITGYTKDLPIIVDKKKAYFDMRESGKFKEDSSHHYHGMGVDGFINAMDILTDPEYAIREQLNNGSEHFAFISTNENGDEVCVVFQMGVTKPPNQMNGYPGGYYNLDITEFVATDEWLEERGVEPGTSYKDYLLSFPGNSIAYDRSIHREQMEKARTIDSESAGLAASYDNSRVSSDRVSQEESTVKSELQGKNEKVNKKLSDREAAPYRKAAYEEWDVQAALYDALDHADKGEDNLIRVGEMPRYIADMIGIEGNYYIYRNHAYENMVSKEQAISDGRPVTRKGEAIHFHDLGVDRMTEAILSLENPTMTIATKTKEGNPAVIMLLPVKGKNKAPLYAVLSFYSNKKINGEKGRKPHVVLTIAEREYFGSKGRGGYAEIVGNAVQDGRVIDFNKKMRDDLSVIANPAGVGDITDSSLVVNLARFRKEIKSFREKNKINYSDRDPAAGRVNEVLEKENGKLKEDVQHLKELLKIQRSVTNGTKFTKTSVEAMASQRILKTEIYLAGGRILTCKMRPPLLLLSAVRKKKCRKRVLL